MRIFAALIASALLAPTVSSARDVTAPVRMVFTSLSAANIVEDCGICNKVDDIYLIGVTYVAKFGDPESVRIKVARTPTIRFRKNSLWANEFASLAFSRDPGAPSYLAEGVTFPKNEDVAPTLFGFVVLMAEDTAGLDPDLEFRIARDLMDRHLRPALQRTVADRSLKPSEYGEIPVIANGVVKVLLRDVRDDLLQRIVNNVNSLFNPDVLSESSLILHGTAFANEDFALQAEKILPQGRWRVLRARDIGKRRFGFGKRYVFDTQRGFVRVRGEYFGRAEMMALE